MDRPVSFLLPGQGSQFAGMATEYYGTDPVFTSTMDAFFELAGDPAIKSDWLGETDHVHIDDVRRAQPLLFAVDYALAKMLHSRGIQQSAMLGHSAGELVAGTLAGVFSFSDGVASQMERVRQAVLIPPGGMLAVAGTEQQLRPYLIGDVAIAAVNAARQVMLAGPVDELQQVEKALQRDDFIVAVVPATSPFHCAAMAPAAVECERQLSAIRLNPPQATVYSGYTAELLTEKDAVRPEFWAWQIVDTVYFGPALDRMLSTGPQILVEVGPGQTLSSFARRHRAVRTGESRVVSIKELIP
ncbi:acyltransferase domain-containing protein [Allorhizocola rhizosphaerae]|uniref:acyltransferase domain-containing protein n=1 Tax=Allorhizocola rhizosphaerae TaxID=1872709 RepID=UPI000E3C557C|nr:acyltransferase domain-containing protein [Allorhizocola rhizosphaerae]